MHYKQLSAVAAPLRQMTQEAAFDPTKGKLVTGKPDTDRRNRNGRSWDSKRQPNCKQILSIKSYAG